MTDDEDTGAPEAAPDPLAAEPLTAEEIHGFERHPRAVSEQEEGGLDALRKATEVSLPFDPDDGESMPEANDERLEIHLRPKSKRRSS